jgi:protein-S-isoprenylcysteine O-methyltransferase Ste14
MESAMVRLTGISLLVCSLILNVLAYREFKKSHTPHAPFMEPKKLIEHGVFSLSRNPVYLALVLSQSGLAFVLDMMWPLFSTGILWILLDVFIVRDEENMLEMTFLNRYKNYKRKTRRWL